MSTSSESTESNLIEKRRFAPPAEFARQAHVGSMPQYEALHRRSVEDPETFWAQVADDLHWFKRWDRVMSGQVPDVKWFVGGQTNLCYNCVDRQVEAGLGDKTAIVWEAEPSVPGSTAEVFKPHVVNLTYSDLLRETSKIRQRAQGAAA